MEMVNGYVFLDLTKANVYAKALKVLGTDKPVVIKDGSGSPYFVDSLTLDGTNVVITKGGKTITIANDNTITSEGLIANPTLENIKDLAGHNRFIDGNGSASELEGLEITYIKWSLSGTHLMMVVSGNVENGTVVTGGTNRFFFYLPEWILDKIYPTASNTIEVKVLTLYGSDLSSQTMNVYLNKGINFIGIINSALTLSADRAFRIQFDLLIDADYSE